jgi:RNA polymerase-binding protein DksA
MQDEQTVFADPNDRATQESDMALELRNRDRERKLIKKITETIAKIDSGDYGYCESCGVEIGLERMQARPTATLCIDCKTLEEIRERLGRQVSQTDTSGLWPIPTNSTRTTTGLYSVMRWDQLTAFWQKVDAEPAGISYAVRAGCRKNLRPPTRCSSSCANWMNCCGANITKITARLCMPIISMHPTSSRFTTPTIWAVRADRAPPNHRSFRAG